MSFIYDRLPTQTFPASTGEPKSKDVVCKAIKMTFADFTTGALAQQLAFIPADASITNFRVWQKTAFTGGGVTAVTLSVGVPGNATKFINALNVNGTAGQTVYPGTINNIFQTFDPAAPNTDSTLLFTGTATTGNPTAGEIYVLVEYVR